MKKSFKKVFIVVKENFSKLRKPKIFITASIMFLLLIPFLAHLTSNILSSRYPNRSKDISRIAFYTSFGFLGENEEKEVVTDVIQEEVPKIEVSPDSLSVEGKRISQVDNHDGTNGFVFSALIKNNSDYGIPSLTFTKITIYDKEGNTIGVKTDYTKGFTAFIPKDGELPFSYYLYSKEKGFNPDSFDVSIEIPKFNINTNTVRLEIINIELLKKDRYWCYMEECNSEVPSSYEYEVSIKNNYDKRVDTISYMAFHKSRNSPLTRIASACCYWVSFDIEDSSISLNKTETKTYLEPGEIATVKVNMALDTLLFRNDITDEDITPVFYFIGVKAD